MTRPRYRAGDRVRLLRPTLGGWIGECTVVEDQDPDNNLLYLMKAGTVLGECTDNAILAPWREVELIGACLRDESK